MPYIPSDNALQIYSARYLDEEARTVPDLFRRVSGGNADYYNLMNEGYGLPNSPTLFNAGTNNGGTLSACFVFDIADALLGDWPNGGLDSPFADSICGTVFKAMAVAKAGGGVGYYLGNIRKKGALVKSTHKKACGPVIVLRFLNQINQLVTQGGKRALAQMGVLPCWHPDIYEFIHCKDENPHELSSFNISVSWRNGWVERAFRQMDEGFNDGSEARLWWEQCTSAWGHGCPGMLFWDRINRDNATPHLGDINATNPCGETPNISDEPCNLASMALSRFFKKVGGKWVFKWDEYKDWVRVMIRFMDDILDWNVFPHPAITRTALATRKLGMGAMGYADSLALMGIPYDTQDAVDWGTELAKVNQEATLKESVVLAQLKSVYPAYESASEETKKKFPWCRNSTRTSIAPTGTIAELADQSSSIEPHYALEVERTTGEGMKLTKKIDVWRDLPSGFVPKTAHEVSPEWHIRHLAAWTKYTDLGVSKTINMPETATVKDVSNAYRMMWELDCKGGTIFRNNCRPEQVLRETKTQPKSVYMQDAINVAKKIEETIIAAGGEPIPPEQAKALEDDLRPEYDLSKLKRVPDHKTRRKLPKRRSGETEKFNIGGVEGYLIINTHPDGSFGEFFVELANDGSTLSGFVKSFAKTFSVAAQNQTPLKDLIRLHKNAVFEPRGMTGDPEVPTCTSIPDYIVQKLEKRFLKTPPVFDLNSIVLPIPPLDMNDPKLYEPIMHSETYKPKAVGTGQFCPDCSAELVREGACMKCLSPGCGFSKC